MLLTLAPIRRRGPHLQIFPAIETFFHYTSVTLSINLRLAGLTYFIIINFDHPGAASTSRGLFTARVCATFGAWPDDLLAMAQAYSTRPWRRASREKAEGTAHRRGEEGSSQQRGQLDGRAARQPNGVRASEDPSEESHQEVQGRMMQQAAGGSREAEGAARYCRLSRPQA
jgi:hypothetical protein